MTPPKQLPFAFEHRPALGGDDFLIAPNNAEAVAWVDRWPDWPAPAVVLHGPPGCGKTHLVQVFLATSGGRALGADDLAGAGSADPFADAPAFAVDGADVLAQADAEEGLLHLYNVAAETHRRLLLTGREPPGRWPLRLADLASRLRAAPACGIGPPDDPLVAAVLVKLFADRQLRIDDGVIGYLATRMERSFDAARRLVAAIDAAALAERRNITVPFVREVLDGLEEDGRGD